MKIGVLSLKEGENDTATKLVSQNPTHKLALLARTAEIGYESPFNQHNIYEKNP